MKSVARICSDMIENDPLMMTFFEMFFSNGQFVVDAEDDDFLYWSFHQGGKKRRRVEDMSEAAFYNLIEKSIEQKKNLFLDYLDENI